MDNKFGKISRISACAALKDGRTILEDLSFTAPYKIMMPFEKENGGIQIMPLCASAGIMAGDSQEFSYHVKEGADLEVLSQSFEKIHKMDEGSATRTIEVQVDKNATLYYYPNSNPPTDIKNTKYDIAYNNWGKKWRMPTDKEMLELISECYYTHKVVNGVSGLQFKGKTGGIIFLPFCGYRDYLSKINQSDWGSYWTSTLKDKINSRCLKINYDGDSYATISESLRCNGLSVRAVTDSDWDGYTGKEDNNTSGGNTGGSTSYEKPDIGFYDFTAYQTKLKVVYKIYNKNEAKVTSAKVYYGTSPNPTKSVSASVAGVLITANISGLKKGTTYYVKCVATGKGGTTTTETTKVITNF